eukprot:c8723_g1_i1.p1 GENE.c8723_g1_i1~~c8723_g1_i1.p1  ORF type:complete len:915 (-),score=205.97 c8723_g1_i1:18-2600(-)
MSIIEQSSNTNTLIQVLIQNQTITIPGSVEIACPKGCLQHGLCDYTNGTCICNIGWYGPDCMSAFKCNDECNYRGKCIADHKCVCAKNFGGTLCEIDLRCPNNCSGHGTCNSVGTECRCDLGWFGEICSQQEVSLPTPRKWARLYPPEAIEESQVGTKPLPRHGHSGSPIGDGKSKQVLVWGGKSGDEPLDDMWIYDVPSHQWSRKSQIGLRPGPRFDHAVASSDTHMFMFGGYEPCDGDSAYSADLWRWSFGDEQWIRLPMILEAGLTQGPPGRVGHSLVRIEQSLLVFGGKGAGEISHLDTWSYAITSGKWQKLSESSFGSRRFHSATAVDSDSFVVFGGLDADGVAHNQLHKYSVSDDSWNVVSTGKGPSPPARLRHATALVSGRLFVFGGQKGEQGGPLADMWAIDLTNSNRMWTQVSVVGDLIGISSTAGLAFGAMGVLIGGRTDAGDTADVWEVVMDTRTWKKVKTVGDLPERRMMHSGNVIDGKLWVFGGQSPTGQKLGDMWEFDLEESIWTLHTPTAVVTVDSAGAYTCGGIDSEEGESAGVVSSEGGVLWPSKRSAHASTVVTGGDTLCGDVPTLIIFGGSDSANSALNDLWYWCPGVQQWSKVASTGESVTPRSNAGVAVLRNVAYVFGGMTADKVRLNDLWGCHLTSGTCSLLDVTGASRPHTRRSMNVMMDSHSSLSQLLVFGGYWKNSNACSTCASVVRAIDVDRSIDVWKYELQYSRWRKMYSNDAPEARHCSASFLIQDRMVMFGGYAIDGILEHNDMWYFNVDALQWRRLPAEDDVPCPAGRHEHTFDKWTDRNNNVFAVVYGGIGTAGLLHDVWVTNITDILSLDDLSVSAPHKGAAVRHVNV